MRFGYEVTIRTSSWCRVLVQFSPQTRLYSQKTSPFLASRLAAAATTTPKRSWRTWGPWGERWRWLRKARRTLVLSTCSQSLLWLILKLELCTEIFNHKVLSLLWKQVFGEDSTKVCLLLIGSGLCLIHLTDSWQKLFSITLFETHPSNLLF